MLKVGPALMEHAEQLERERGIPKEVIIQSIKDAMVAAYRRQMKIKDDLNLECQLHERSGELGVFHMVEVVDKIQPLRRKVKDVNHLDAEGNPLSEDALAAAIQAAEAAQAELDSEDDEEPRPDPNQMLLKDARKVKADVELGETLAVEVTPDDFGRIAAQSAKQVITQRIREAEKGIIFKEFEEKKGSVTSAIVQRIEGRNVFVSIGRSEAILTPREQLSGEYYRVGDKLRVYVMDIRDNGRTPQIMVSQTHAAMVREIFELEVPEIEDGIVEIRSIAREAGYRTKVAVGTNDPSVDPQGACIGARGSRIQAIVSELKNEKIDIIRWSENPHEFITSAIAPAKVINVAVDPEPGSFRARVVVPDDQLSLAIGREGQNVRLASKLTGYRLDIKSYSQAQVEGFDPYTAPPPGVYMPAPHDMPPGMPYPPAGPDGYMPPPPPGYSPEAESIDAPAPINEAIGQEPAAEPAPDVLNEIQEAEEMAHAPLSDEAHEPTEEQALEPSA
jgi:N utilization substance protein A